ncbi:MAG: MurR/RpiR family transcriptional regulator [Firmicutes bacterium]|nr:MurR/RpiR family transcriptional regulator [Bacillota bacterium]
MGLLERFRAARPRLSANQRSIAEFILERPEDCAFLTAGELGRRVGVSESTVVRFAVAVGFAGYPELQRTLRDELKRRLTTVERLQARREELAGPADSLRAVWENDINNIHRTFRSMPREDFERAVNLLAQARRVYVIGLRTSACVALLLTTALQYLGKEAVRVDLGIGDFWDRLDMAGPGDVVVGISVPRYTRWTTEMVRFARAKGAVAIALTDSPVSPLAELCDVLLPVATDFNSVVESFVAPLSVANALILGVAMSDEAGSLAALRRREALWESQQLYEESRTAGRGDGIARGFAGEQRLMPSM